MHHRSWKIRAYGYLEGGTIDIDETITATDESDAKTQLHSIIDTAIQQIANDICAKLYLNWIIPPHIQPAPEDQEMRAIEAPQLFIRDSNGRWEVCDA